VDCSQFHFPNKDQETIIAGKGGALLITGVADE
jgi:hypothetical protein